MNRAERRRECREQHLRARSLPDWVVVTTPGCDEDVHSAEVNGAAMALIMHGPWSGPTKMDCGCSLEVRRA